MTKKNKMKPALLVIDIQHIYLQYIPDVDKELALKIINIYIEMFRKQGFPIIRIYHVSKELGANFWNEDHEFPETVSIKSDDIKVIKTYPDAFNKTELDKVLTELGCNTLFLCGLSAVGCVLATWMGAFNHDYKAFLLKDAIMSHKKHYTENVETMFDAVGRDVVELVFENAEY